MRTAPGPALTVADLSPANFAVVMATGVLGLAAHQQGDERIARIMLALAGLAWVLIVALTVVRLLQHRQRLLADLRSHQRAPGFFTAVAGTAVLGSQWFVLGLPQGASAGLATLAAVLWVVLTYGILMTLILARDKPLLADGISGSWLLTVVSTQSVAVLAALLASHTPQPARLALNFGALTLWLCGGMLYVWVISLIFYRYAFLAFGPEDQTPTYWINMGAMAISGLAGALLVQNALEAPFLQDLLPFLKGGTLLYWAVGTWWIPMLVGLTTWRYVHRRHPLRYDVAYWAAVFPLGMYSASTHEISRALHLRFLAPVASFFFWLALAAWLLATSGLARQLCRPLLHSRERIGP